MTKQCLSGDQYPSAGRFKPCAFALALTPETPLPCTVTFPLASTKSRKSPSFISWFAFAGAKDRDGSRAVAVEMRSNRSSMGFKQKLVCGNDDWSSNIDPVKNLNNIVVQHANAAKTDGCP